MANNKAYYLKLESPDPARKTNPFEPVMYRSRNPVGFQMHNDECIFGIAWGFDAEELLPMRQNYWIIAAGEGGPDSIFRLDCDNAASADWGNQRDCRYGFDKILLTLRPGVNLAPLLQKRNLSFEALPNGVFAVYLHGSYLNYSEAYRGFINKPECLMQDVIVNGYSCQLGHYAEFMYRHCPFQTIFPDFAEYLIRVLFYFSKQMDFYWRGRCVNRLVHTKEGCLSYCADYWDNCVDPAFFQTFRSGDNVWVNEAEVLTYAQQQRFNIKSIKPEFDFDGFEGAIESIRPKMGAQITDHFIVLINIYRYRDDWDAVTDLTALLSEVKKSKFEPDYVEKYLEMMIEAEMGMV